MPKHLRRSVISRDREKNPVNLDGEALRVEALIAIYDYQYERARQLVDELPSDEITR